MIPIPRCPAFFDTESYPNYWLLRFRPMGAPTVSYALTSGERFTSEQIGEILRLFDRYMCVGFYSKGYDQWTIARAIGGGTCEEMYETTQMLIVEKIKGWQIPGLQRWEPADHVDIMDTCPGAGSQKVYAGRTHARTMRDLPYPPGTVLTPEQIVNVFEYCGNDLDVLEHLYHQCEALLRMRVRLGAKYGLDLRSKSDAGMAAAVLKKRCEEATGKRIYYEPSWEAKRIQFIAPAFIDFTTPELKHALNLIRSIVFTTNPGSGAVMQPPELENLVLHLGRTAYKVGIGGLHSQEKCLTLRSDENTVLLAPDVASYYPSLIINSGEYPPALGPAFRSEYIALKQERLAAKATQAALKKAKQTASEAYDDAEALNEGGKVVINATFGLTGNVYSPLNAPNLMLQTTLSGQLSLLMLIEWHELYGIPVVSANTDGIVIACPRRLVETSKALIAEWERRTGLVMETAEWRALHARDVNSYFAITSDGQVKRKGDDYAPGSFINKKNPNVEICADAVEAFLLNGTPVEYSIMTCRDIRKFVTMQVVAGGANKMWGEGPLGTEKVSEMIPRLEARGWTKGSNRKWRSPFDGQEYAATDAFALSFVPQRPEYLGKVVRWYYGTRSPGHIVYTTRNAKVGLSYGATPCMTLPDTLPSDIDYAWYIRKARGILEDVGYRP